MASDDPFISADDLSEYLGRDVTADTGAVMACDAACGIVRSLANGQTFNEVLADTFYLDGSGTDCLVLPEAPTSSAGTVVANGETLTAGSDYVVADERLLVRTSSAGWSDLSAGAASAVWPLGRQNIMVVCDHGYATVPRDVRMVALQIAERVAVQGIAQSETVAGQSITYASPALDPTPGEKLIIAKYRSR